MRVAIVSDIHGNRPAFEAVLEEIAASGCEALWCLGDLVGYGADPDACVALVRAHATICLAGNHDLGVCGALPLEEFSHTAAAAAAWTRATISPDTREYLTRLAPQRLGERVGLYHASPRDPVWEYVLSAAQAEQGMELQHDRVCLIGHSHIALSFSRTPGVATSGQTRTADEAVNIADGDWLINPGSVGQPRDGDPRAAWLELDLDGWSVVFRRVAYDITAAAAAIRSAGLPASLAERLYAGQ